MLVLDTTTGHRHITYHGHDYGQFGFKSVMAVAWSPNAIHIASASHDKTVQVWDATTGNHLFTYSDHTGGVNAVAWSPDGSRIASAGYGVQVWQAM